MSLTRLVGVCQAVKCGEGTAGRETACENARMQRLGSSVWLEHGRCREVRVKGEEKMNRESRKKPDHVGVLGKAYGYPPEKEEEPLECFRMRLHFREVTQTQTFVVEEGTAFENRCWAGNPS